MKQLPNLQRTSLRDAKSAPTLQDVAEAAGVAKATASRVLNGNPRVAPGTATLVREAARTLGYHADPLVSSWARTHWRKRLGFSGVATGFVYYPCAPNAPVTPGLLEGVMTRALHLGYQVSVINAAEYGTSAQLERVLLARGIHALVLYSLNCPPEWLRLDWDRYSVVSCDVGTCVPPVHLVTRNHFQLARLAYSRAYEKGYRRIAWCIQSDHPTFDHDELMGGFRHEHEKQGGRVSIPCYQGDFRDESGFLHWYRTHRPDALISNCPITYWWLKAAGALKHDGLGFISLNEPEGSPVTGAVLDHVAMAEQSLELLDQCVRTHQRGLPARCLRVNIDPVWNEGGTLPPAPR